MRNLPMSPSLIRHCHDYQNRAGLKNAGFSVDEDGHGGIRVIMSCENDQGDSIRTGAFIMTTRSVNPIDHDIYLAVMMCTETLVAKQSTLH
jgi:hypothetical protein